MTEKTIRILSCDTAHGICSVALLENGSVTRYYQDQHRSRQAEQLFNLIDQALGHYRYDDIDALAVNIGPGSFTGIRVGLAAMKGLKLVTELPLIPVSSLSALAHHAKTLEPNQTITAAIDAGRNQLYIQHYNANGNASEPSLIQSNDFNYTGLVVGNGGTLLQSKGYDHITLIDKPLPDASDIALCAYDGWLSDSEALSAPKDDLLPLYLRAPDAKKMKTAT